ncbi:MAG: arsenic transporter [Alphaproteobacteria bacterium]|nr:arsenic transporter [Alphaproteobacteria bacterium]
MSTVTFLQPLAVYTVAALATAGVILRPFSWPEAIWAMLGAALLVILGLLPIRDAFTGIAKGTDVYLFLIGMMLLAELARQEGLFDWLAARAARLAAGSARRLFLLIYGVGTLVTIFLSNDATAVVLTPAVAAAARAARAEQPLPFLLICAFIANAASFVLPISNPANLVIYGNHMPALLQWLPRYALPSLLSIIATYLVLRWTQRQALRLPISHEVSVPALSLCGRIAAFGIAATAVVLMTASAFDVALGLPTFLAGLATAGLVLSRSQCGGVLSVAKNISWGVLPLVAGLFVLVEALDKAGLLAQLSQLLHKAGNAFPDGTAWGVGAGLAALCNVMNNLPAGLIAGNAVQAAQAPPAVTSAVLIGIDLGPNLSVTGSLATILWLTALRREGQQVSAWAFLKLGALIMPPALVVALAAALIG